MLRLHFRLGGRGSQTVQGVAGGFIGQIAGTHLESLIHGVCGGTRRFAFLTSSQVMPLPLVQGSQCENRYSKEKFKKC